MKGNEERSNEVQHTLSCRILRVPAIARHSAAVASTRFTSQHSAPPSVGGSSQTRTFYFDITWKREQLRWTLLEFRDYLSQFIVIIVGSNPFTLVVIVFLLASPSIFPSLFVLSPPSCYDRVFRSMKDFLSLQLL